MPDVALQLSNAGWKNKVFNYGFLLYVVDYGEDDCPLREAQQAGTDQLAEQNAAIAVATSSAWSRQLAQWGIVQTSRSGKGYIVKYIAEEEADEAVNEFLNADVPTQKIPQLEDLTIPIRIKAEAPIDKELYKQYIMAFKAGIVDLAFIKPKDKK